MEFEYEFGPSLVALACLGVALCVVRWLRHRRFHHMTPREREMTLMEEKRARDHFAGRD